MDTLTQVATALRVLAHPVRLQLVEVLLARSEESVGRLAEQVRRAPSAVSQHLKLLKAHGHVDSRREGHNVFYRVISPEAVNLIECIRTHHTCTGV